MTTAIAQALSAALLHFVWQGLLAAFLLWVALFLLRKRSAHSRYLASCIALSVLALLPAITASTLYRPAAVRVADVPAVLLPPVAAAGKSVSSPQIWLAAWQSWAVPVWSLGVLLFSLRLAWGCKQVSSLRRRGTPAEAPVLDTIASLAVRLGVTRRVRVLVTSVADGPSVAGWIRPVLLLPSVTLLGLTPEQLETVLAHELAHIRRHDYLVNLLQNLVETLLFYHPAVWWMSARIREERELCCDDLAVSSCGNALCYARALTRIERLRVAAPGLAMASTGGPLLYRIQRLIGVRTGEYGPSKLPGILALCLGLACFAMNVHWAQGQSQEGQLRARTRVPGVVGFAFTQFPDAAGVSVDLGGTTVLHRTSIEYPGPVMENAIQGTVTAEVTLDPEGSVSDAHIMSGPQELRRVVLRSLLEWHFLPGPGGSVRQVNVTFDLSAAQRANAERPQTATNVYRGSYSFYAPNTLELRPTRKLVTVGSGTVSVWTNELAQEQERLAEQHTQIGTVEQQLRALREQQETLLQAGGDAANYSTKSLEAQMRELETQLVAMQAEQTAVADRNSANLREAGQASAVGHRLARIDSSGFSVEAREALVSSLPVRIGDTLSQQSIEQIGAAIQEFDPHIEGRSGWRLVPVEGGDFALRIVAPNSR